MQRDGEGEELRYCAPSSLVMHNRSLKSPKSKERRGFNMKGLQRYLRLRKYGIAFALCAYGTEKRDLIDDLESDSFWSAISSRVVRMAQTLPLMKEEMVKA
jgi:hypothetical protein